MCNKENLVTNEGKKLSMSMLVFRIFSFPQVKAYRSSKAKHYWRHLLY